MNDGSPEAVEVFVSTGGDICVSQFDADDEVVVVALRPKEVPHVIKALQRCLAKYEEMIEQDPQVFGGEEQLTLSVGAT